MTSPLDKFGAELKGLINENGLDNLLETPDFVLSEFLVSCLAAFAKAKKGYDD